VIDVRSDGADAVGGKDPFHHALDVSRFLSGEFMIRVFMLAENSALVNLTP
jgi:hypothetical protein